MSAVAQYNYGIIFMGFTAHSCCWHPYASLIMLTINQAARSSQKKQRQASSSSLNLLVIMFIHFSYFLPFLQVSPFLSPSPLLPPPKKSHRLPFSFVSISLLNLSALHLSRLSLSLALPTLLPPPSWQSNVVGRLIEEVCRFVRQSNQSASHKTTS